MAFILKMDWNRWLPKKPALKMIENYRRISLHLDEHFTGSGSLDLNQESPTVGLHYGETFSLGKGKVVIDPDESPYPIALKF